MMLATILPLLLSAAVLSADGYEPPQTVCALNDRRIHEASGIAASRAAPDTYYIHNDSGNPPLVFQVDRDGRILRTIHLAGARNLDWEDVAMAPRAVPATAPATVAAAPASVPAAAAAAFDVCVADIGDNGARRRTLTIYRFADAPRAVWGGADESVRATAFTLRLPDGPQNAEGFAVDPLTGDGYLFTKRADGNADVYRLSAPWPADGETILTRVMRIDFGGRRPMETMVTAADISPDGRRLVLRSYTCGWEWTFPPDRAAGSMPLEPVLRAAPRRVDLAAEPQGEALCYSADGAALLTISEELPARISEARRAREPR